MSGMLDAVEPSSLAREELAQRWADVVNDPVLRNLPLRDASGAQQKSSLGVDIARVREELGTL